MEWWKKDFIEIRYTQPNISIQNRYVKRLNGFFREDALDAYYFSNIYKIQKISDKRREDYNFNPLYVFFGWFINVLRRGSVHTAKNGYKIEWNYKKDNLIKISQIYSALDIVAFGR
jgi:hypothetical protein